MASCLDPGADMPTRPPATGVATQSIPTRASGSTMSGRGPRQRAAIGESRANERARRADDRLAGRPGVGLPWGQGGCPMTDTPRPTPPEPPDVPPGFPPKRPDEVPYRPEPPG